MEKIEVFGAGPVSVIAVACMCMDAESGSWISDAEGG